ncbi:tetratricopeptide repeat protein [Gemmobacter caeruleus]|uniref:tetratricopeptide repeat protein n=1 Tax=Gemmobacter caeruleus TaxID=2595004 RepID=UPI0011F029B2|nr:SEL1-like repeat protein [Gemmobacter caeruleus]
MSRFSILSRAACLGLAAAIIALMPGGEARADSWGNLNPEEGGIAHLAAELAARPDRAGFLCWVVYETQKGGAAESATSFKGLQLCAQAGNAPSMILLAQAYDQGLGTAPDAAWSTYWVKQAAAQGYATGAYHYGLALLQGHGVPRDAGQARFWLDRAAQGGDRDAARLLANLTLS